MRIRLYNREKRKQMPKKHGLPRQLEEEAEKVQQAEDHPLDEFLKGMFGNDALAKDQDGLPSLEWLKSKFKTKSAAIRYLVNQNTPIKIIAKHLGIKYQHARNVATQQLKRGPNEDWHPKPDSPPQAQPEEEEDPSDEQP